MFFTLASDDVFLFDTLHVFDVICVSFVEKKRIENISQWLWKDFVVICAKKNNGQVMRLFLQNLQIWDTFLWQALKMAQWNDVLGELMKKRSPVKSRRSNSGKTLKRWDTIYQLITLTLHSRCILLHGFLQHAVPKSSFYISLSTVTAWGPLSKQFVTCVNYYPRAGWVGVGTWFCYSKECLRLASPLLVHTRTGPRCLTPPPPPSPSPPSLQHMVLLSLCIPVCV